VRASKKFERDMDKLAAFLEQHGADATAIHEIKKQAPEVEVIVSRSADAVIKWLEKPQQFTQKICKREACKEPFATNYTYVAYCSDNCRSKVISEQIGVEWDWHAKTEEERWGGQPPLIVPPAALRNLLRYVQFFADNLPNQLQEENLPDLTSHFLDQERYLAERKADFEKFLSEIGVVP
jgi:hypothetical protein